MVDATKLFSCKHDSVATVVCSALITISHANIPYVTTLQFYEATRILFNKVKPRYKLQFSNALQMMQLGRYPYNQGGKSKPPMLHEVGCKHSIKLCRQMMDTSPI